jgi:hypothetical protein
MDNRQKQIAVIVLMLVFASFFIRNTRHDLPLIFEKDLRAHDESSNSVVSANITRKFFPPMVRVNPLVEKQGNWMEGPFWQHIPPLFAYVPYPFFILDGEVTIEIKRLSFAFVVLLTGLLFIWSVYKFRQNIWATLAATIAAIAWIYTPFTHELITGYAFGVSDIVLTFTVIGSFAALLWYLNFDKELRLQYPLWKLVLIGSILALPIMAKNLLGAIPIATFFIILLHDYRTLNKKILIALGGFVAILLAYLLPLYFSSPETFKNEILISFLHMGNLEGWGRPWHYYVTNYLPQRYLFGWTWVYFTGLILGLVVSIKYKRERKSRILLTLSGGWFLWNLITISLVESKIANFIFQSYLLSLFFITYSFTTVVGRFIDPFKSDKSANYVRKLLVPALLICILLTSWQGVRVINSFNHQRAQAYDYDTEKEKFYQAAEKFKQLGLNTKDMVIVHVSDNDCWFRYPILFLTGAEAKTLLELSFGFDPDAIKQKYNRIYFVIQKQPQLDSAENYSYIDFELTALSSDEIKELLEALVRLHKEEIDENILRIKKDKTSCQWLVPDHILNTP